jgi:DNA-binding transcriptional ArsR family regulator
MFVNQMASAIADARTLNRLDDLSRAIWQGWSANAVTDDQAQELASLIHARKLVMRGEVKPVGIPPGRPSIFPPRRLQRAPNRPVAIARRRHLAASGPLPPSLACKFTVGELAALRIVADEVREKGRCDRTIGEIAARAGIGRTTAQNAFRAAAAMGLLTVQERRREGQKNLSNVVRIVSREWLQWIKRGGARELAKVSIGRGSPSSKPIGFKKTDPTGKESKREEKSGIPPEASEPQFQPPETLEKLRRGIRHSRGG